MSEETKAHARRKELAVALLAVEQDIRYKRFGPMAVDPFRGETLMQAIRNRLRALGVNVDEASQVKPMFQFSEVVTTARRRIGALKRLQTKNTRKNQGDSQVQADAEAVVEPQV